MGREHHAETQVDADTVVQRCCIHHTGGHDSCDNDSHGNFFHLQNVYDDHRLILMYLVWSGRRKERQLMGMPRDVRGHHRDKPAYHPPSASPIGPGNRSWRSSEQKQQIAVAELSFTEWRRSRKSKGPEPENAHASALYPQRHRVGQR
jgi:hypothetical protein